MVRLKEADEALKAAVYYEFQFQCGTIKSRGNAREGVFSETISIPVWYD